MPIQTMTIISIHLLTLTLTLSFILSILSILSFSYFYSVNLSHLNVVLKTNSKLGHSNKLDRDWDREKLRENVDGEKQ
jgi:hypothetical protein